MQSSQDPVVVCGAGLTGSLFAVLYAKAFPDVDVEVYELRDLREDVKDKSTRLDLKQGDFRGQLTNTTKRSINLALSHRGIESLKSAGVWGPRLQEKLIPMHGRFVHTTSTESNIQLYGQDHQAIYSVSRTDINELLLDAMDECDNIKIHFGFRSESVKPTKDYAELHLTEVDTKESRVVRARFVIGADGAFSAVRASLLRHGRVDFSQEYVPHGYKELCIDADTAGKHKLKPNYLHIWPRHKFMLIALPNPDGTFTATLFAPWKGTNGLEQLASAPDKDVDFYFKTHFADVCKLVPDYLQQFRSNPSSPLMTIVAKPWNHAGRICVIGDAAHALVPFYGQGMNCGFEDALMLVESLKTYHGDDSKSFSEFSADRQPAATALAQLSLRNYVEMGSLTAKPWFVYKKMIEKELHTLFPSLWVPLYSMVTFSRMPYHFAMQRAQLQDRTLFAVVGIVVFFFLYLLCRLIC